MQISYNILSEAGPNIAGFSLLTIHSFLAVCWFKCRLRVLTPVHRSPKNSFGFQKHCPVSYLFVRFLTYDNPPSSFYLKRVLNTPGSLLLLISYRACVSCVLSSLSRSKSSCCLRICQKRKAELAKFWNRFSERSVSQLRHLGSASDRFVLIKTSEEIVVLHRHRNTLLS